MFTKDSWNLESNNIRSGQDKNSYLAMGAIIFSFSAIESNINEFYKNLVDEHIFPEIEEKLTQNDIASLKNKWKENRRENTLKKYETVFELLGLEKYSTEAKNEFHTYRKTKALEQLRNALSHYQPEDSLDQKTHKDIKNTFKKYKITPCKYFDTPGNPYFPDQCLGHGHAEWALLTALEFIESFYTKLQLSEFSQMYERRLYPTR